MTFEGAGRKLWYLQLEPVDGRYTAQLSEKWFPWAFGRVVGSAGELVRVPVPVRPKGIRTGKVLDGVTRGIVSMGQCSWILEHLDEVGPSDVVFLQDFWTPGIEAVLYALALRKGRSPKVWARCFAQSVDEYDFTWGMRSWMRPMEVGLSEALAGLFVASTVHRDQLRAAGYTCPIHVTGLPFMRGDVAGPGPTVAKQRDNRVVYSSRLNAEKNPWFMLEVAKRFLDRHEGWEWVVCTGFAEATSELAGFVEEMEGYAQSNPRFRVMTGLTKDRYYSLLGSSRIQFNSALQDYVAFTMLEAAENGCDLVYPLYRSFPECVDPSRLYEPFRVSSALDVLEDAVARPMAWMRAQRLCEFGMLAEVAMMMNGYEGAELNVWHNPPAMVGNEVGLLPLSDVYGEGAGDAGVPRG